MVSPWFYFESLGTMKNEFTECFERKGRGSVYDLKIKTAG